jgi:hemoglobin
MALVSIPITRRTVVAGLALTSAPAAVLAGTNNAYAQATQTKPEKSLYERLGGVFAIAAVVDHFSDAVVKNPIVGQKSKNPQLREWHTKNLGRLPGLKFMRTLWVSNASGGPFQYTATKPGKTPLGLEEAHRDLRISPDLMKSQRNSDEPWISSKSRSARKVKSWQPSPHTKTRLPPGTSRPLSAAKASCFFQSKRSRSAKTGGSFATCKDLRIVSDCPNGGDSSAPMSNAAFHNSQNGTPIAHFARDLCCWLLHVELTVQFGSAHLRQ